MKTFKINNAIALAIIAFFGLFLSSCEKTALTPDTQMETQNLEFSKEIQVKDASGENSLTLLLSTDNKAILEGYDNRTFSLVTLLEETATVYENNPVSPEELDEADDFSQSVMIEIKDKQLQKGVVRYQLRRNTFAKNTSRACRQNFDIYKNQNDRVDIRITAGGNGKVVVSRQNGPFWAQVMNVCGNEGNFYPNIGWTASPQIKVKISTYLGYTLNFHN